MRTCVRLAAAAGGFALLMAGYAALAPAAGAAGNDDPGPPGNNGTVKLDGVDLFDGPGHSTAPNDPDETEPDNDPHLTCGFQLEFFNFDAGQLADITFTAHAPTGTGGVLLAQHSVVVSDDGTAGAALDPDAVFDYDVLTDFDTSQFTSVHDRHGWHVKVDLTLYEADGRRVPGGQKHKVFWVEGCQPVTPEPEPEVEVVCPPGMVAPAGETLVDGEDDDAYADNCGAPEIPQTPDIPVVDTPIETDTPAGPQEEAPAVVSEEEVPVILPEVLVPSPPRKPTLPTVTPVPAPQVEVETRVLPAPAAAPEVLGSQTLPRTGTDATTTLALVGLGLLVTGGALRRRSAQLIRAT